MPRFASFDLPLVVYLPQSSALLSSGLGGTHVLRLHHCGVGPQLLIGAVLTEVQATTLNDPSMQPTAPGRTRQSA